ncbi:MAG: FAD-binding oxidoreductase [Rhodospirillales bacterium]|nr:FAD-binding oxidoreductase [Rhodospirillales bacterium]MDP6804456.1 FAD-binding oxidoreductase [Rhodospirillales bacterium]
MSEIGTETDVLVVGGGIIGCSTAYFLARDGVEVVVVDRGDINTQASGVNAGSLHVQFQSFQAKRTDGDFPAYYEESTRLLSRAVTFWQELAVELDCDVEIHVEGGLMLAETEDQMRFLEAKIKREQRLGLDVHIVRGNEMRDLAPYVSEHAIGGEFCTSEGRVNPTLATPALLRGAVRAGARLLRHTELLTLTREKAGFVAQTDRGAIRAKRVVNAAGVLSPAVAAMAGIELPVVFGEALHMNVSEAAEPFMNHLVQHAGYPLTMKQATNGNVIVGGGWPAQLGPAMGPPRVLRPSIQGNLWVAQRLVSGLAHLRLLRCWTGVNVFNDGKAILGKVPAVPGFFMASTGIGYTLGPLTGRLVASAVQGKRDEIDIETFSITRLANHVSAA